MVVADWGWITPNGLTFASLVTSLLACLAITLGGSTNLLAAAIVIQISYVMDCMDGQLARYRGLSSKFGAFADKWSDFVKFPAILLALTLDAFHHDPTLTTVIAGFAAVFLVGYLPYLKSLASTELGINPWSIFSNPNFASRNLRFFLFEEAQWYLAVSVCLAYGSTLAALFTIAVSQGVIALAQTVRILMVLQGSRKS
ncbi:MAG: CDP-alcohol phosphatidyltransferase family protein [Myxococcota bacterium]